MKTDSLIDMLATQAHESQLPRSQSLYWALWLTGCAVAAAAMLWFYKLNPNLLELAMSRWFWLRFAFLASLGLLAWTRLNQLRNPGRAAQTTFIWLALPSALMAALGLVMILLAQPQLRWEMLLGVTWRVCSLSIALLALPIFASSVLILRSFAPTRLRLSGAVLGIFSGALAALIYTLHCPELHPAFLAVWYSLGMLIPAVVGWLLGERLLKW